MSVQRAPLRVWMGPFRRQKKRELTRHCWRQRSHPGRNADPGEIYPELTRVTRLLPAGRLRPLVEDRSGRSRRATPIRLSAIP